MKRLDIGEKAFRNRRGRWVPIPDEWIGQVAHPQTIRKRDSKRTRKSRNNQHRARYREGEKYTGIWHKKFLMYKRGEDVFGETELY